MMDWLIQVFRVLRVSNEKTYFMSAAIMDHYLQAKKNGGFVLDKANLHLLGLASILLSSKYEDIRPVSLR